jgi:hypothetical protein
MTDYNKLTVANLRQLLKDRSIPSTGLTRKAQIVAKLEEADMEEKKEVSAVEQGAANTADQKEEAAAKPVNGGAEQEPTESATEATTTTKEVEATVAQGPAQDKGEMKP